MSVLKVVVEAETDNLREKLSRLIKCTSGETEQTVRNFILQANTAANQ